jgi:hypothetical protein
VQTARFNIYEILSIDTSVTSLLSSFTVGATTYPAIFNNQVIPTQFQDLEKTIQIFPVSSFGSGDYRPQTFQVSCRSTSEAKAIEIAQKVYDALNRVFYDGYMQAVIQPPAYEDYHWLCPVEVNYRR